MSRNKLHRPLTLDFYARSVLLLVVALEIVLPLSLLPPASLASGASWSGAVLLLVGLALEVVTARAMTQAGTTTKPNGTSKALLTEGPFRYSRNPFYCGVLLLLAGIMLMLSLDWLVLGLPLLFVALDRLVVPHEEQRLAELFGAEWQAYAARTRRWL